MLNKKIGFIGCGNMAEALIKGILAAKLVAKADILGYDVSTERRSYIKEKFGIKIVGSNPELISQSEIIILAVKPQHLEDVLVETSRAFGPAQLIISIVAGVTTQRIQKFIKAKAAFIRAMPNTPALVGCGISAITLGPNAGPKDKEIAMTIFRSVGEVVEVKEEVMDAVTAISGSGPAYFFYLIESLIACAVRHGLSEDVARKLANQTALGSSRMVIERGEEAKTLRERVTSRGGVTEAAFEVFNKKKLAEIYSEAIEEAIKRSKELSGE